MSTSYLALVFATFSCFVDSEIGVLQSSKLNIKIFTSFLYLVGASQVVKSLRKCQKKLYIHINVSSGRGALRSPFVSASLISTFIINIAHFVG